MTNVYGFNNDYQDIEKETKEIIKDVANSLQKIRAFEHDLYLINQRTLNLLDIMQRNKKRETIKAEVITLGEIC